MEILVIGTSNTIVKGGWFDSFTSSVGMSVTRIALGGAPFLQFMDVSGRVKSNDYRAIVVETSPNDESYPSSVGSAWTFDKLYHDFIVSLNSIAPVFVLRIPPQDKWRSNSPIASRQKHICELAGAHYFDATDVMLQSSREMGAEVYRDKYHPTTPVAARVGAHLSDFIRGSNFRPRRTARPCIVGSYALRKIDEFGLEAVSFSNSLVSEDFSIIPLGGKVVFDKPIFCLGFWMLSGRTNAMVRFEGPRESRDILCRYRGVPSVGAVQFVPITDGFMAKSISVIKPWESLRFGLHSEPIPPPFEFGLSGLLHYIPA
ncbi:hypothetical protein [Sphingobium ummariense]|uniref:Uncharacterized protein n=1 Tax=Sphingobium ummariense RL-3 TaxID=1346791 RepID=T0IRU5_9SPHN|nr:hypothetical protein [Sphingobium ummariense]EQB31565.1 hypothetical protein M529_13925 [Sphingobium ummariense RL-3]